MASPFLKRYLLALNRYKWPGLFTFTIILGASAVAAFQPKPPPTYVSEGVLADNTPLVTFSDTSTQVATQGLGIINEDLLRSDLLLTEVSAQLADQGIVVDNDELVANTQIRLLEPEQGEDSEIQGRRVNVVYVGDDPNETQKVLSTMFQAMIDLSQATNRARLRAISENLDQRLPDY